MEANALYFPYIKVPKSAWFTRILLYWDKVGAIIPSDMQAILIESEINYGCRY